MIFNFYLPCSAFSLNVKALVTVVGTVPLVVVGKVSSAEEGETKN